MHETVGIIHRDIKPENLLLDENDTVKITDFGTSLFTEDGNDEIKGMAGSTLFLAPELCKGGRMTSGKKCDVWALGVTLYFMIFKKYPFIARSKEDLYNKIQYEK